MSNLYLFLYLQLFVKKMMVTTPGLPLYMLCPNSPFLSLPVLGCLWSNTALYHPNRTQGHSFL